MRWWSIDPVAAGVFGVPAGFAVLLLVSLLSQRPREQEQQLIERLRVPLAE
jgi:cation/acetate symporter